MSVRSLEGEDDEVEKEGGDPSVAAIKSASSSPRPDPVPTGLFGTRPASLDNDKVRSPYGSLELVEDEL